MSSGGCGKWDMRLKPGDVKKRSGPRLIHVYTKKGKGFAPAEADQIKYHAISKINARAAANPADRTPSPRHPWP